MFKKRVFLLFTSVFLLFGLLYGSADTYPSNGEVTGDNVYVRAGASQKYETLTKLSKGSKLTILGLTKDYYLIKCPTGVPAWIHGSFVDIKSGFAHLKGTSVNIRARAKSGTALCQVSKPAKLRVLSKQGEWIRIEAPSTAKVYIAKDFVKLTPKETEKPVPSVGKTPEKTPEKEAPIVKWQKKFEAADKAFEEERARSIIEADFSRVKTLYNEILESKEAEELHSAAKQKVALCNFYTQQQEAYKSLKDKNEDLEERLKQLQEELEKKLREIEEERKKSMEKTEEEKFLATGTVFSIGGIINRPATHRLVKGEEVIYLLKSSTINLDDYWGKYVGVKGTISPAPKGWDHNIITVTEIKILDESMRKKPEPSKK